MYNIVNTCNHVSHSSFILNTDPLKPRVEVLELELIKPILVPSG